MAPSSPFNWAGPSKLAKALTPHPGNKKPGAPITLTGTNHGGTYSKAVPPVTDAAVKGADSMWGNI